MTDVSILSLATAVPPHKLRQADIEARARKIFAGAIARFPQLADVFVNSGIEERYSVRPIEWFDTARDFTERSEVYLEGAGDLFVKAAEGALARASLSPGDVDVVVTVSSTGIATP